MTCALAELVPWKEVPRLPFEAAALPQSWYRFARMPVVSYALPALIAIGQCVHHHRGTWNPLTRLLRWLTRGRTLQVLRRIQPTSGGYLEATPLTSFVVMALASSRAAQARGRERGDRRRRAIPGELGAARRQLADRHEPRDVGDDALGQRPGRGRRSRIARHEGADSRVAAAVSSTRSGTRTPAPTPAAGPGPICRAACRTATTRRGRCWPSAISPESGSRTRWRNWTPRMQPLGSGLALAELATVASRPSAAAGERFRSTEAAADLTAHALRAFAAVGAWSTRRRMPSE